MYIFYFYDGFTFRIQLPIIPWLFLVQIFIFNEAIRWMAIHLGRLSVTPQVLDKFTEKFGVEACDVSWMSGVGGVMKYYLI